jgi:hypothetical protein
MIVIVGKGSDLKKLGFAGIEKCSHCKNYAPFWLCEYSRKLTAYFVPVVKYKKQILYVCETCDHALSVKEGMENEAIRDTVALPSREDAQAIWNTLNESLARTLRHSRGQDHATVGHLVTDTLETAIAVLKQTYQPDHVDYIGSRYIQHLGDPDCPQ